MRREEPATGASESFLLEHGPTIVKSLAVVLVTGGSFFVGINAATDDAARVDLAVAGTMHLSAVPPETSFQAFADDCLPGQVVYRAPETMQQGETRTFLVRISRAEAPPRTSKLPGEGPVTQDATAVCDSMKAELSGAEFDINPPGVESPILAMTSGSGEWEWRVKPRDDGVGTLNLRIYGQVEQEGNLAWVATYEKDISVEVSVIQRIQSVITGWFTPLGLSVPVLVGGVIVAIGWMLKSRYKGKHEKGEAER